MDITEWKFVDDFFTPIFASRTRKNRTIILLHEFYWLRIHGWFFTPLFVLRMWKDRKIILLHEFYWLRIHRWFFLLLFRFEDVKRQENNFVTWILGWGQNLERRNVERPIFRNFKITNIKTTIDESIDSFIFE